jgi:hypothetical protein
MSKLLPCCLLLDNYKQYKNVACYVVSDYKQDENNHKQAEVLVPPRGSDHACSAVFKLTRRSCCCDCCSICRSFGNEDRQGNVSDLTFIVQQQLHPAFRRLADDLYAIVNVPLVTALTGGPVALKTLGGQLLTLPVGDDVITPGSELVLADQGMPVFGDSSGRRGALYVRFNVNFPSALSRQQQLLLRDTLKVRGGSLPGFLSCWNNV